MSERIKGTVKWFSMAKGYGFITPDGEAADDVFAHFNSIQFGKKGQKQLAEGERVEFEKVMGKKGKYEAQNITQA